MRIMKEMIADRWQGRIPPGLRQYFVCLAGHLLRIILALVIMTAASLFFLFFCRILWEIFISTQIGGRFLGDFPGQVRAVELLLGGDLVFLAGRLTGVSFVFCLIFATAGQIFQMNRNLFFGREGLARFLYCALPVALLSGFYLSYAYPGTGFMVMFMLSLIPTMGLFGSCFEGVNDLFPEPEALMDNSTLLFEVWNETRKTILYYLVIIALCFGVGMLMQFIWADYSYTPAWWKIRGLLELKLRLLFLASPRELLLLFFWITTRVFIVYLILGAILQLTHLGNFYLQAGGVARLMFFGLIPGLLVVRQVMVYRDFNNYLTGLILTMPVVFMAQGQCYSLTRTIIPKLGELSIIKKSLAGFSSKG